MTPEQFVYWLNGYFEITDLKVLGIRQCQVIKDHLDLVFGKETVDRSRGDVYRPVKKNNLSMSRDEMASSYGHRETSSIESNFDYKHKRQVC